MSPDFNISSAGQNFRWLCVCTVTLTLDQFSSVYWGAGAERAPCDILEQTDCVLGWILLEEPGIIICQNPFQLGFGLSSEASWVKSRHRIPKNSWGWKRPVEATWSKPPAQARATQSCLPRIMSRCFLSMSREGDSAASLDTVKLCFLVVRGPWWFRNLCFSLCHLCCHWAPMEKGSLSFLYTPPSGIYTHP